MSTKKSGVTMEPSIWPRPTPAEAV
jgi:hypothetical protein